MRKYLLIFAVALLAVSIAGPALADVQFLYGGEFRFRVNSGDNVWDGTDHQGYYGNYQPQALSSTTGKQNGYYNAIDNRFYIDQRLRLYFTFVGSKNLKVVTKFEIGDTKWGDPGDSASIIGVRAGQNGGGNIGADQVAVEVKNAYIEFNLPTTCFPTTAMIGIQSLTLMDSWIIGDDFSAAVLISKLDPFRVTIGYVGGQNGADKRFAGGSSTSAPFYNQSNTFLSYANADANIDDGFLAVDYTCAPWKASFVGFYQSGHKSNVSIDPTTLTTPISSFTGISDSGFMPVQNNIKSNDLFDLGFNLTYKVDYLLAYVNFIKNLGQVDYINPVQMTTYGNLSGKGLPTITQSDYTGWMVEAGATYYCPPYTFNIGGFYLTGPNFSDDPGAVGNGTTSHTVSSANPVPTVGGLPFRGTTSTDAEWFTYPLGTAKYTSEIIGGGVLADDMHILRGYKEGMSASSINLGGSGGLSTMYWRGYYNPTNLWTITAGASWQVCPDTKISASYWYWNTAESVPVAFTSAEGEQFKMSSSIGHELDLYVDQKVVDNLTLTLVGAYLFANDAWCPLPVPTAVDGNPYGNGTGQINPSKYLTPAATDAWKLGARLLWNF